MTAATAAAITAAGIRLILTGIPIICNPALSVKAGAALRLGFPLFNRKLKAAFSGDQFRPIIKTQTGKMNASSRR
jgi:hypothetical protein